MAQSGTPKLVVHVIRSAGAGGVEAHVKFLASMLMNSGHRPVIIALSTTRPHPSFEQLGCELITLCDRAAWGVSTVKATGQLVRALRHLRPDVVHLHGARPICVGSIAARLAGCRRIVAALHGAYNLMVVRADGSISFMGERFARLVHGVGFLLSTRTMACAKALLPDVERCLAAVTLGYPAPCMRKVRVFYHGIDPRPFLGLAVRDRDDSPHEPGARPFVIGTLGRLDEPKKGVGVLLDAVAALQQRGVAVSLKIGGSGHSRTPLERRATALGLQRCDFLGFFEKPLDFYRQLDAFVMPSLSEGMPLTNFEAMVAGLPVVTTDVGGTTEAVIEGVTGLVVPPGDAAALAGAIERLATSPDLASRFAAAGRARVLEHFTTQVMFRRILEIYAEMGIVVAGHDSETVNATG